MSIYYVNINNVIGVGDGTESTPFNYNQLVNFFNPDYVIDGEVVVTSATDGDVVNIMGTKTSDYNSVEGYDVFISLHKSLFGSIKINGWDVLDNGSPVVWNNFSDFCLFDRDYDIDNISDTELNLSVKNIIFDNYEENGIYYPHYIHIFPFHWYANKRKITIDFKTNVIHSVQFSQYAMGEGGIGSTSAYSDFNFYGCTLDVSAMGSFGRVGEFGMYDCALLHDDMNLYLGSQTVLKADNNITTLENYTTYVGYPGDVTQYTEPILNTSILGYSKESNSNDQITYYQTKNLLEYPNFNIPDGGATDTFRTTNDYATGLFGDTRVAYGAYVFEITNNELLNGHIGSFYFGGDFDNVQITVDPGVINFQPISCAGVETSGTGAGVINLIVPEIRVFFFDSFPFDFSGTPVEGSSPLYVDYHVYNYEPRGKFAGLWEAYEFRWWFDYETSGGTNDYIAVSTDRTNWLYCGIYGQKYDVRCCVMYRPIE